MCGRTGTGGGGEAEVGEVVDDSFLPILPRIEDWQSEMLRSRARLSYEELGMLASDVST